MDLLNSVKLRYCMIALLAFVMAVVVYISPIQGWAENHALVQKNDEYLTSIEQVDKVNIFLLSEMKGVISTLESSEIGISIFIDANIEIGKVFTSFSTFIENALNLTLSSLAVTEGTRWLLKLCEHLSPLLLVTSFICLGLLALGKSLGQEKLDGESYTKRFFEFTLIVFLTVYLIIPYSVYGTSLIDKYVYEELQQEKNQNIKNLHADIVSNEKHETIKQKAEADFKRFEEMAVKLPKKINMVTDYHIQHFVYNIFRSLIIPLFMFFFLYVFLCRHLLPAVITRLIVKKNARQ